MGAPTHTARLDLEIRDATGLASARSLALYLPLPHLEVEDVRGIEVLQQVNAALQTRRHHQVPEVCTSVKGDLEIGLLRRKRDLLALAYLRYV